MGHQHDHRRMHHHWSAPEQEAKRRNPVPANPGSIERGKILFQAHCASCHGQTGRGDGAAGKVLSPSPADLRMAATHHPDGDLAWKIATGRGPMPAWKGALSDDQIWDLVKFIKTCKASTRKERRDISITTIEGIDAFTAANRCGLGLGPRAHSSRASGARSSPLSSTGEARELRRYGRYRHQPGTVSRFASAEEATQRRQSSRVSRGTI
jgi:mono/diheme cytochrome c family protein